MATYNGDNTMAKRQKTDENQLQLDIYNNAENRHFQSNEDPVIRRKRPDLPPNRVLLYTILNARYPVTTEVIHNISAPIGRVNRIVIFRKRAVQAMVEFADVETAIKAKEALDGADIYSGCCTLKIEFAKPIKLNVFKNDMDSWDFTLVKSRTNTGGKSGLLPEPISNALLQKSTAQPIQTEVDRTRSSSYLAPPPAFHIDSEQSNGFDVYNPYMTSNVITSPTSILPSPSVLPLPPPPPLPSTSSPSMEIVPAFLSTSNSKPLSNSLVANYQKSIRSRSLTTFQPAPIASSPVLMVYDLEPMRANCDRLFNLFCLYGNVIRIKFLKTKEGCAMVQMSDQYAVDRCMANLNPTDMLAGRELSLGYSKQAFVSENRGSSVLPDGTEGFKDYSCNRHNRYYNQTSSMKNRIQPPSRILHFYNTPTNISEEELINVFNNALEGISVVRLKLFPKRGGADGIVRSSTGLVEFNSVPESVEALMTCNHLPVKSQEYDETDPKCTEDKNYERDERQSADERLNEFGIHTEALDFDLIQSMTKMNKKREELSDNVSALFYMMGKYQKEVQLVRARTEAITQAFKLAYRSHIETQQEVDQMLKHWADLYNYFQTVLKEMKEQHETQSKEIQNLPSIEDIVNIVKQQEKNVRHTWPSRNVSSNSFQVPNYLPNQCRYRNENMDIRPTNPEYNDPKICGGVYRDKLHVEPRPLMSLYVEEGNEEYNDYSNYNQRENLYSEDTFNPDPYVKNSNAEPAPLVLPPSKKKPKMMATNVPAIEKAGMRINKKKTAKSTTIAPKMLPQLMSVSFTDVVEKVGIPKTIPDALNAVELMLDYVVQYSKWEKYIADDAANSIFQNTIKLYPRVWSGSLDVEEKELNLPLTEEDRKRLVIKRLEQYPKEFQEMMLPKTTSVELPEHIVREGMKDDIDARCPILFEMNVHGRKRYVLKMLVRFVPELDHSIVSSLLIEKNNWRVQFEDDSSLNCSRGGFWAPTRVYCCKRGRLTMVIGKNSIIQKSAWRCTIFNKPAVILGRDYADMIRKIDYTKQKIHLWDEVAEQEIVKDFLYDPVARARLCSIYGKDMLDDVHLNRLETWTKVLDVEPTLLPQAEAGILCEEFWKEIERMSEKMKEEFLEVEPESLAAPGDDGVASGVSDVI